jgi:glycosyltransferase involved in cell wall biosynthesis
MIRILHLIDQASDWQSQRCAEQLASLLGEGFLAEVRAIGSQGDWRSVWAAARTLRRRTEFDIVHTWSGRALLAAALALRPRIIHTPPPELPRSSAQWVRAIMACRNVHLAVPTSAMQRALFGIGIEPERCCAIPPGVDFASVRRRRDRELRAALGLGEEDYVLLAAGESTPAAGHTDATWAAGILHVLDPRYRLLLWGRGEQADAVLSFDRRIQHPGTLVVAQQRLGRRVEFEDLLPAADMIVNSATGATAALPLLIAMASGLPIVSTATRTASELLEDHHNALLVAPHSPRKLAQRIMELREDRPLQWRLCDTARAEAYEYYPLTRFLDRYRTCYRQSAAGEPIDLDQAQCLAAARATEAT